MDRQVLYRVSEDGIATITLNRPQAANALSQQLLKELEQTTTEIQYDTSVRCVLLTAAGDRVFCAGADLKERANMNPIQVRQAVSLIRKTMNDIESLPQPVIAVMNGMALGGGLELALACDIRMAADHAKFALTETSLGIIPGAGGTQRLPRLIGKGKAKELIFTARRIDAEEAENIRLVEHVVPTEKLMDKANELAQHIVQNAPISLTQAKMAINKGSEVDLHTGLAMEQSAYDMTIPTKDRIEGLQAFKEKRKPIYKGE
ncbi:enoyl-CoA hydratase [Longirhabdus pacifica]|uniref:enoyl-CoA hydratase n=1 Tax=Longirhabdus pacifica TaxID=2305227 RepID=UPI001008A791|nr:enoyl-CoA hydratase [Longirhabdus pacifica]